MEVPLGNNPEMEKPEERKKCMYMADLTLHHMKYTSPKYTHVAHILQLRRKGTTWVKRH